MTQPTPLPDALVVAAYQQQTVALRSKIEAAVAAAWRSLGSWRQADIKRFTKQVTPVVLAGQKQMATLTTGYLSAQRHAQIGRSLTVRVDPSKVSGAAARNGVAPAEVYERPFHLTWRQLADLPREPGSIDQAIQSGQDRAVQSALTDLQLSKRMTIDQVQDQDQQVRWAIRVLEGAHSCALCVVASTQRYHNGDLKGIHPACDCTWKFVYSDSYPDQTIDLARLHDIHALIKDRFGVSSAAARAIPSQGLPDYRDVLVTHEHGELGAVLAVKGAPFADADDYGIPPVVPQNLN